MNTVKFLGTAGARIVVFKQLRASGGLWINFEGTNLLIDPGPGSLVRCLNSHPKLDPTQLSGIVLTHRHLDHSADINIMIEAMSEGGLKPHGVVFAPKDALEEDPVILRYVRKYLEKIVVLEEGGNYQIGNIEFSTPKRHLHGVETYGIYFKKNIFSPLSLISDTRYFAGISDFYHSQVIIINVLTLKKRENLEHLCIDEAKEIIRQISPKKAIITHFGMTMLKAKPWELARQIGEDLGIEVIAASDGMTLEI